MRWGRDSLTVGAALSHAPVAAIAAVRALHGRVSALSPWGQRLLALVLGCVAVFAMPPVYQVYLLVPAFSGLVWLIHATPNRRQAFLTGWWFGVGFFGAGMYWVSFALLVDAEKFAWLVPFAIFGFAFGLGLFIAVAAWGVRAFGGPLIVQATVLASLWTVLEWVRSWIFTGLPWNPVGSVWAFSDSAIQAAAQIGVFGLSLFTVWAAAAVGALAMPTRGTRGTRGTIIASVLVVLAFWAYGQHRLSLAHNDTVDNVRLRLVQPNIAQADKWKRNLRASHMATQLDLSLSPTKNGGAKPTHIIWAETATPFFIANAYDWLTVIGDVTPKGGLTILGAPRVVDGGLDQNSQMQVSNSLLAIDDVGAVTETYDKFHLVPFGEYVPLADWLPLDKITQGMGAFTPGPGPRTLNLKGLPPVGPLICYEIIFPHAVTDPDTHPHWLLNLTNDAWYGNTAGPYQHFVTARFRAVEEGLPTVRVAFTGISGIVDGFGRVTAQLGLSQRGFVDGDLPKFVENPGLFRTWGNGVPLALSGVLMVLGVILRRRARTP